MPCVHSLSWPYSCNLQKWANMKAAIGSYFYGAIWREKSGSTSLKISSWAPNKALPQSLKMGCLKEGPSKGCNITVVTMNCWEQGTVPMRRRRSLERQWKISGGRRASQEFILSLLWLEGISKVKPWTVFPKLWGKEQVCQLAGD